MNSPPVVNRFVRTGPQRHLEPSAAGATSTWRDGQRLGVRIPRYRIHRVAVAEEEDGNHGDVTLSGLSRLRG